MDRTTLQEAVTYYAWQKELLQAERYVEENTHLRFNRKFLKNQLDAKNHAGLEQPKPAESCATKTFQSMDSLWHKTQIDQCAFMLPDSTGTLLPVKKPTTLALSDPALAEALHALCPGCQEHLSLEGSSGIAKSSYCGFWCGADQIWLTELAGWDAKSPNVHLG